jgi:hypothetical protein
MNQLAQQRSIAQTRRFQERFNALDLSWKAFDEQCVTVIEPVLCEKCLFEIDLAYPIVSENLRHLVVAGCCKNPALRITFRISSSGDAEMVDIHVIS